MDASRGYQKITDFWFYLLLFLVMLNCSTVIMLTMQVEAVAIYCICCIVCVFGCISWSIDSRCAGKIWSFSMDRSCRCSVMCVCLNQVICFIFIRFFCLIGHAGKGDCFFTSSKVIFMHYFLVELCCSSTCPLCLLLSSPLAVDIYFWPYWYWNKKQWFIKQALSN